VSLCQKKSSSGLYDAREDNRGRHKNHPASATPSGLISDPPPSSSIFTLDALPAATLPLYPGLGQAPNMLVCIPSGLVEMIYCTDEKNIATQMQQNQKF